MKTLSSEWPVYGDLLDKYRTGRIDDVAHQHELSPFAAHASRKDWSEAYAHVAHDPEGLSQPSCYFVQGQEL